MERVLNDKDLGIFVNETYFENFISNLKNYAASLTARIEDI
jgi:hypothetical protein